MNYAQDQVYEVIVEANADEYRCYFNVFVWDLDGQLIQNKSFTTPEDAEEFADQYR